jgi:TldD protein
MPAAAGRVDLDFFLKEKTPEHFATEAAREAIAMLDAVEAPAGETTVVLGPGWPGILLHEAVGHGLEADFNRKGVSAFSGRIGQKVASELCTVIDDGTIGGRRGSLNVDDEGQPTQRNVLIEKGILQGYLQDKLSSSLLGGPSTGSGRRESYAHIPMPRMTNTFMLAGEDEPEDIIRSVSKGLYCKNLRRRAGGHHQRQLRVLRFGELSDRGRQTDPAGAQCDAERERPGIAPVCQPGRQ